MRDIYLQASAPGARQQIQAPLLSPDRKSSEEDYFRHMSTLNEAGREQLTALAENMAE